MREKNKILCFGELLLRMSPDVNGNWLLQNNLPVFAGGAELNVASALAQWGLPVKYCTALPENFLGKDICSFLRKKNIDTSAVQFSGNRMGVYYLQPGNAISETSVVYDREHSSFAALKPGSIDWDDVLQDVSWFLFSAISPALNNSIVALCTEALKAASLKGITIAIDLNYRKSLWKYAAPPHEIMWPLVSYCDVVMGNIWSVGTLLNIKASDGEVPATNSNYYQKISSSTAEALMKHFPKCKTVANTFRMDTADAVVSYFGSAHHKNSHHFSKRYNIEKVISRVGTGDCFMAGLIYGLYHHQSLTETLELATVAAVGKFNEPGDSTHQSMQQIKNKLL
jgi:2-dehydro-3-deoxygluconokinase